MGGHLDSNFTFKDHALVKCIATTLNINKTHNIKKYLTKETCHKLTLQLVSHVALRLCKFNASRTAIIKYKNHAKNPKHSCKTNAWKKCQRKHHGTPLNLTLVTNTAKDRLQNMYLIHKCCSRKAPTYLQNLIHMRKQQIIQALDQKTRKLF